jgi:hypothetical protein
VEAISLEEGQFLIKCSYLETIDRGLLTERLRGRLIPARVGRRGLWLELRGEDRWRQDLLETLQLLAQQARG